MESKATAVFDDLLRQLISVMENVNEEYEKRTFEIRKSVHKRMKTYRAKRDYTQKTFINVAIAALLNREENETK